MNINQGKEAFITMATNSRKKAGIYAIESPTGAIYIGQSHDISSRFSTYRALRCQEQPRLYNSLVKHTPEAHDFRIIHYLNQKTDQKVFDVYEIEYMKLLRANGHDLMNVKEGGSCGKHSKETKSLMSRLVKERFLNEDYRNKYIGVNNHFFGKKHSPETRKMLSESSKGRKISADHSAKLHGGRIGKPAWNSGKRVGDGTGCARKISQHDISGNLIKEHETIADASIETGIWRQSISNALAGRYKTAGGFIWKYLSDRKRKESPPTEHKGGNHASSRTVLQFDLNMNLIKEFDCITTAANELNLQGTCICRNAKLKSRHHGGFIWRYKEDVKVA